MSSAVQREQTDMERRWSLEDCITDSEYEGLHPAVVERFRTELRRLRDAEMMLRAMLPCSGIYGGPKAPSGMWILDIAGGKRVPDDGTGLPALTDAARAALTQESQQP